MGVRVFFFFGSALFLGGIAVRLGSISSARFLACVRDSLDGTCSEKSARRDLGFIP